jgi:CRP/FNR family transcriptional regulator
MENQGSNQDTGWANFFSKYPTRIISAGQIIISPGETPSQIHYVEDGYVIAYLILPDGSRKQMNRWEPRDFFPIAPILHNHPTRLYDETAVACSIRSAPVEDFLRYLNADPVRSEELTSHLMRLVEALYERLTALSMVHAKDRLATWLQVLGRHYGRSLLKGGVLIDLHITHEDIASSTNLSRETVSRELRTFQEKGCIKYQGNKIVLLDPLIDILHD